MDYLIDMTPKDKKLLKRQMAERGLQDPGRAYSSQKGNAKNRGIHWDMTFDEWWSIWNDYYHLRGVGTNGLVMARNGDVGPYSVSNVHLTTKLGNAQEHHRNPKTREIYRELRAMNYANKPTEKWMKKDLPSSRLPDIFKAKPDWEERKLQDEEENY